MAQLSKNCLRIDDNQAADSKIEPCLASIQDLKNGKYICDSKTGLPGVISSVRMSKTGKHGHAKFTYNLFIPFTEQTSQEMQPGHTHLHKPIMKKYEMEACNVENDGRIEIMDNDGNTEDLYLSPDYQNKLGENIGEKFFNAWQDVQNSNGEKLLLINILEGPVCDPKKIYMVKQITGWQIKEADD